MLTWISFPAHVRFLSSFLASFFGSWFELGSITGFCVRGLLCLPSVNSFTRVDVVTHREARLFYVPMKDRHWVSALGPLMYIKFISCSNRLVTLGNRPGLRSETSERCGPSRLLVMVCPPCVRLFGPRWVCAVPDSTSVLSSKRAHLVKLARARANYIILWHMLPGLRHWKIVTSMVNVNVQHWFRRVCWLFDICKDLIKTPFWCCYLTLNCWICSSLNIQIQFSWVSLADSTCIRKKMDRSELGSWFYTYFIHSRAFLFTISPTDERNCFSWSWMLTGWGMKNPEKTTHSGFPMKKIDSVGECSRRVPDVH